MKLNLKLSNLTLSNLTLMISAASLGVIALGTHWADPVRAQEGMDNSPKVVRLTGNTADALEQAYFQHAKNGFDSMSLLRQWLTISGGTGFPRGSYPEISIERDTRAIHAVYQDIMMQQAMNDPTVRVPDLPNPYSTSLMTLPSLQSGRVMGTEFVYDRRVAP
jgi:hypothetical protein